MRFLNKLHERLYSVSKYNTTLHSIGDNLRETSHISMAWYKIYVYDEDKEYGFQVIAASSNNLIYSVNSSHKFLTEIPDNCLWLRDFEKIETELKDKLEKAKEHERELESIAGDISQRIR